MKKHSNLRVELQLRNSECSTYIFGVAFVPSLNLSNIADQSQYKKEYELLEGILNVIEAIIDKMNQQETDKFKNL